MKRYVLYMLTLILEKSLSKIFLDLFEFDLFLYLFDFDLFEFEFDLLFDLFEFEFEFDLLFGALARRTL